MPDQLTRRFQHRIATIGDRAAGITATHWAALPGHDEADIPAFAHKAGPTVQAAKQAAVATGVAYYALRNRIRVPAVKARSVPIEPDFREPFIAYWQGLKNGHPLEEAQQSGFARAGAMTHNLAVSAARLSAVAVLAHANREPSHWIRTPDADACPWCIEVADLTFATAEDADIGHDRCGCSIDPAF